MSTKRNIPSVPRDGEDRAQFDRAVKDDLEFIMGHRGGRIEKLPDDASLAAVISKINELIERLQ